MENRGAAAKLVSRCLSPATLTWFPVRDGVKKECLNSPAYCATDCLGGG